VAAVPETGSVEIRDVVLVGGGVMSATLGLPVTPREPARARRVLGPAPVRAVRPEVAP
jgi:hypothetical protein